MAQTGLWREAQYRWERAVELDPTYAEAWNNLAIAYEHTGKFDDARKAYETALKLDPKNTLIRQNYDLFKEINDRTRNAAAVASLVLLCTAIGCTNFYEVPIETPIQPKMDVTPFTRILVAGFISGGSDDVDGNLETVRLLRSQLRSKSTLRVIEAEVLPLVDIAREQGKELRPGRARRPRLRRGGAGRTPADPPPSTAAGSAAATSR